MKVFRILSFAMFYLWEVILSNLRVARDILLPNPDINCGIVAVPIEALSDRGVALLANLISMTPGTLSLDFCSETRRLFIHTMYLEDEATFIAKVQKDYEQRISSFMKGKGADDE